MNKVNIRSGAFAGFIAELVEAGPTTSKVKVSVFGRDTIVELSNDSISTEGPFDPFASFAEQIRSDRYWAAGMEATDWWLEREHDVSAKTWTDHLQEQALVKARISHETERLVEQLRSGVSEDPTYAEIEEHFRAHEEIFRPFRVQWRKTREGATPLDDEREERRARRARELGRTAYRAWWAAQIRPAEGCRDVLEAVWSGDDYEAMVETEYEAFDRWGREAVELIVNRYRDEPVEVRELQSLPAGHRWRGWAEIDPGKAVRLGFAELAAVAPRLVDSLAYRVRAIYAVEQGTEHYLVYACDAEEGHGDRRRLFLSLLVGGPGLDDREIETLDARLPEYTRSRGWSVPEELQRIYRVHHGLGRISAFVWRFDNMGSIYPAEQLEVLGELMNEIAAEQDFEPDGYRFDDLLTFFEDGAGNGENFFRPGPGEQPTGTVDWDHETREVSSVRTFWEFLEGAAPQWWFGDEA